MRPACAPKRRSSKPARKPKPAKRKRVPSAAQKRAAAAAKKKRAAAALAKKRSAAAKKGWAKRRGKEKLAQAIQRAREERSDQPLGWIERRAGLRENNGSIWRQISIEYSEKARDQKRLEALAKLKIDMLSRDDLRDYLEFTGEELEIDTSDMYRFYLGYPVGEAAM